MGRHKKYIVRRKDAVDHTRIFTECYAELSQEARAEIDKMINHARAIMKAEHPYVSVSRESLGGVIVALMMAGYL